MALIELFTPGGNLFPHGSSTFATLLQFFQRQAQVRDLRDQELRDNITIGDQQVATTAAAGTSAAENRAKTYADTAASNVITTVSSDTNAKVAAGESRTRTYTDTKATETLGAANTYTDVSFQAVGAGEATDAAVDAAVERAVLAERVASAEKLPENGARAVGKGELNFNIRDYGAKGDGVTDDGPAIQAAVNAALSANSMGGIMDGRTTPFPSIVFFPPGVYYVRTAVSADLNPAMAFNIEKRRLVLQGAANDSVFITFDGSTATTAFHFWRGFLTIDGIHFDGKGSYTGVMLEMGRAQNSDYVNQFQLNRVNWGRNGPGGICLKASWAFDGTVTDNLFLNMGSGIAIDFPSQAGDNCNNWAFRRVHLEMGLAGTFIRARSLLSSSNYHTQFSFDQCHWESRSYNTRLLDLEGCSRWTFVSCQFTQSNSPTGDQAGVTVAQTVSPLRLVNCNSFQWIGGSVSRQGTPPSSWPTKPLSIGGTVRAIQFQGTYFFTNTSSGMGTAGQQTIWGEDPVVPLAVKRGAGVLRTTNCMINSFSRTEMFDELQGWSDPTSTNIWTSRFDPTSKALTYGYGADGEDVRDARVDRLSLRKDGGLVPGYYGGTQITIADGATQVFNIAFDNNPNKRGVYLVYANDAAGSSALVFSSGQGLEVLAAGSLFAVGNTHPQAAGKYNLFLSGVNLTVANLRGSSRSVAVVPFGLV